MGKKKSVKKPKKQAWKQCCEKPLRKMCKTCPRRLGQPSLPRAS